MCEKSDMLLNPNSVIESTAISLQSLGLNFLKGFYFSRGRVLMFVKKIIFLSAIAMMMPTMVFADSEKHFLPNPDLMLNKSKAADKNVYAEVHLGYARQNYYDNQNFYAAPPPLPGTGANLNNHNNARGGFAAGVDVGYQINKYFAFELGWFHLPTVNVMQTNTPPADLKSWAMYLATKYMMPIAWMNRTDLFFKLGLAYRKATLPASALAAANGYNTSTTKSTFLRPMFTTGLNYNFNKSCMGVVQYAYFMGANNSFPILTPNSGALGTAADNIFTLGLGYRLTV